MEKKKNTDGCRESCLEAAHTHHHTHAHTHPHTQTKAVLNRMARLIGHMQSVRRMVEDGRDCSEVLLQLSAVDAALKNVGKIILKDHMEHCIIDAVQNDDREALARLEQAIDRFVRGRRENLLWRCRRSF